MSIFSQVIYEQNRLIRKERHKFTEAEPTNYLIIYATVEGLNILVEAKVMKTCSCRVTGILSGGVAGVWIRDVCVLDQASGWKLLSFKV